MKNDWVVLLNLSSLFFVIYLDHAVTQSPPQLGTKEESRQQIVRPGVTAVLKCPLRNFEDVMIEWYKDKEAIIVFRNTRFRKLSNGSLRIKDIAYDDTGVYKCRAVNGFGSVEFNTTLLVIGNEEDYEEYGTIFNAEDDEEEDKISLTAKPRILYITESQSPVLKKIGSSFMLQCVSDGQPRPTVLWYKDGIPITDQFRLGRWALRFTKVIPTDSGNYTCVVSNLVGETSHSFVLEVDEPGRKTRGKPLITGFNTTVEEGEKAVMECGVESAPIPHIEWLKQVSLESENPNPGKYAILMEGEYFNVLTKPFQLDYLEKDGVYYHKLMIENAQLEDAGKYVCLGANSYGYDYQFTYLEVIPNNEDDFQSPISFPIVVTVIVVVFTVFGCIFVLLFYYRPRRRGNPEVHSVEVAMATKEGFIPMHEGTVQGLKTPKKSNNNRSTQQVTYVASPSSGGG